MLARMAELAAQYPRYGYRRIAIFLGRDGHVMSFGRVHRLWRQARLQVPRKRPRKRIATGRPRPNAPTGANQVWCVRLRVRLVRQRPAAQVPDRHRRMDKRGSCDRGGWPHPFRPRDRSVVAARVRARRTAVFALGQWAGVCLPRLAEVDRRPGIATALIDPGKPWQNGATESFNGKFRDECLSLEWFRSRTEAKVLIEAWRQHFNNGAAAFEPRLSHAGRVRGQARAARRDGRPRDGADRCGIWGLRAPPRRTTVPQGANESSNRGGRLKLNVVRRNRAGQNRYRF